MVAFIKVKLTPLSGLSPLTRKVSSQNDELVLRDHFKKRNNDRRSTHQLQCESYIMGKPIVLHEEKSSSIFKGIKRYQAHNFLRDEQQTIGLKHHLPFISENWQHQRKRRLSKRRLSQSSYEIQIPTSFKYNLVFHARSS